MTMARETDIQHRFISNPRIANKIVDEIQEKLPQEAWESLKPGEIDDIVLHGVRTGGETE